LLKEKAFIGRVFYSYGDLQYIYGVSKKLPIICSTCVNFITEYRVYIIQGIIISIQQYDGDISVPIPYNDIYHAISLLEESCEKYSGYAIDFGLLDTGQLALVEMNDGYAIGAYGDISSVDYYHLIMARWEELMI
jgi:hypothetical protein